MRARTAFTARSPSGAPAEPAREHDASTTGRRDRCAPGGGRRYAVARRRPAPLPADSSCEAGAAGGNARDHGGRRDAPRPLLARPPARAHRRLPRHRRPLPPRRAVEPRVAARGRIAAPRLRAPSRRRGRRPRAHRADRGAGRGARDDARGGARLAAHRALALALRGARAPGAAPSRPAAPRRSPSGWASPAGPRCCAGSSTGTPGWRAISSRTRCRCAPSSA